MDFKELMDTFATDVGMTEPVAYEEENLCHLDINDRDYGFRFVPEAERLVVWTAICERPPESGEAFLVQLLRANFMNQGVPDGALSLSDDDVVYAHCALKMPVYNKAEFYSLLQRFVKTVDEWREMITFAGQAKEAAGKVRSESTERSDSSALADMLRV